METQGNGDSAQGAGRAPQGATRSELGSEQHAVLGELKNLYGRADTAVLVDSEGPGTMGASTGRGNPAS